MVAETPFDFVPRLRRTSTLKRALVTRGFAARVRVYNHTHNKVRTPKSNTASSINHA
jgi:hypothetical protein